MLLLLSSPVLFPLADVTASIAATSTAPAAATAPAEEFEIVWSQWIPLFHHALVSGASFILILVLGYFLRRMFRHAIDRHELGRPFALGVAALALYVALVALYPPVHMAPRQPDVYLLPFINKIFAAVAVLVGLRLIDRLVIVQLLTRGGHSALPRFAHQIILALLYLFAIMGFLRSVFLFNIDGFLAGSAVVSIVLGLALQESLGNFFSGLVMQASGPFQLGDWINVAGVEGRLVDMTWRAITVHTNQDNYVIVPNSMVAKDKVINYSSPTTNTTRSVKVGVDYDVPPNQAQAVLIQAALETPGVLCNPRPGASLANFADSSIEYTVWFVIADPQKAGAIEQQVRVNIWYRLKQAGYGIPFPIRTIQNIDIEKKMAEDKIAATAARRRVLEQIPLLPRTKPEFLDRLAEHTTDLLLAAGQVIYRQGDGGRDIFVIARGSVEGLMAAPDGRELNIGAMEAVNFFGEYSATTGKPRSTTMRAKTDVHCVVIDQADLQEIFDSDPQLMKAVSQVVADRAADRAQKMKAAGEIQQAEDHATPQHSILDSMRRLFGKLHLPGGGWM